MVAPTTKFYPKFRPKHPIAWPQHASVCLTELLWRTRHCVIGDTNEMPRLAFPGAQLWMQSKNSASGTWWCAQRQHLRGIATLLRVAPMAGWYLMLDTDTLLFPAPLVLLLKQLQMQLGAIEHLYTGHLHIPLLHPADKMNQHLPRAFVATGGGCLLRGRTLRLLRQNATLARIARKQRRGGPLHWAALDWVLGAAMAAARPP
jgi:hypothetical protein